MVMTGLLMACLGAYLFMAISVFKSDKTQLVFDLNRSQAANLTGELETQFGAVSDKLKLYAMMPAEQQSRMAADLFSENSDIVFAGIFEAHGGRPQHEFQQEKFIETYGLDKDHFAKLTGETPIPFERILRQGQDIWNASGNSGPPLIGYGRLVVIQDKNGYPVAQLAVVGFVRLDRMLKTVAGARLSQVLVANRRGEVLVHPDGAQLLKHPTVVEDPLFQEALAAKAKVSLVDRDVAGGRVLAALARAFDDQVLVIARAPESEVFQVVRDFTVRTLLFGTIVLTLVILAGFLLARSITENIALLSERMARVSAGDLTSVIALKGRDETIALAETFNAMIRDLKDSRDALETMNRELDRKVKERTLQLEEQNRKVKEVQEALIRTTRLASVGEIAGRAAHEVLNPLTILLTRLGVMQKRLAQERREPIELMDEIRQAWQKDFAAGGFTEVLRNWQSPSKMLAGRSLFEEDLGNLEQIGQALNQQHAGMGDDLAFLKEEAERIGKIINAMRRLGNLKSETRATPMHAVLSDCSQIMADLFAQKGFTIHRDFKAEMDVSAVDRDEMIQAVTNLMRNSLQALEAVLPGEQPLALTLRTFNEGPSLVIRIEDNGVGIKPEYQGRLFESSFTTKAPDQGTGLGLGISRRFVRAFGGEIEFVSSQPRVQTIFQIRLPVAAAQLRPGAVA